VPGELTAATASRDQHGYRLRLRDRDDVGAVELGDRGAGCFAIERMTSVPASLSPVAATVRERKRFQAGA